ncbi:MAG: DUF488 domain-containing protein [Actinobacteria bacterium]|nr:DUF488 domain-containing protein [Actinomycetota bacterium]
MKNNLTGYIITASISSLKNIVCDEVWQITRSGPYVTGAIRVPELSPSPELFHQYIMEWKQKHPEEWWQLYTKRFIEEMNLEAKLNALRKLYLKAKAGKIIALVCFCSDSRYCHRTLVGDFLRGYDVDVVEYQKEKTNIDNYTQLALF